DYALADVEFLPVIYRKLSEKVNSEERKNWLEAEEKWLTDPESYSDRPEDARERIKHRDKKNSHLGVLLQIAKWRDLRAREANKPRRWMMKDESLMEIALRKPSTPEEVKEIRNIGSLSKNVVNEILAAVKRGVEMPKDQIPQLKKRPKKSADPAVLDL